MKLETLTEALSALHQASGELRRNGDIAIGLVCMDAYINLRTELKPYLAQEIPIEAETDGRK